MKRWLFMITMILAFQFSYAVVPVVTDKVDNQTTVTVNDKKQLEKFSKMTVKEYETYSGKKMNLFQKLAFKSAQRKAAKQLKASYGEDSEGFNLGGFALGFFLPVVGILLSFLSPDRNFRKWAWWGFRIFVAVALIVSLAMAR